MTETKITSNELISLIKIMEYDEQYLFFQRAAEMANLKLCQICLDAGLNINMTDRTYGQPLLVSLMYKNIKLTIEVADWFIENGYDITLTNELGYSPLTCACLHSNYTLAKYFLDKTAVIHSLSLSNLQVAVDACAQHACGVDIVKLLLDAGVSYHNSHEQNKIFFEAIKTKNTKLVELFLSRGTNPNFYIYHKTPLQTAIAMDDIDTVRVLIEHNADVNAKIHHAGGYFLAYGALTPLDIAIHNKNIKMQELLSLHGAKCSTQKEKLSNIINNYPNHNISKIIKNFFTD